MLHINITIVMSAHLVPGT